MPVTRNIRTARPSHAYDYSIYRGSRLASSATPPSPTSTLPLTVDLLPDDIDRSSPEAHTPSRFKRRSNAGKKSPGHVPRPKNAFIIFRSHFYEKQKLEGSNAHAGDRHGNQQNELSKQAATAWRAMSVHEKQVFVDIAAAEKAQHKLMYPDYVYAPGGKPGGGKGKGTKKASTRQTRQKKSETPSPPLTPYYPFPFTSLTVPRRAAAQRATEKISQMDVATPPSSSPTSSISDTPIGSDGDFVATSDIPPLDLNERGDNTMYPDLPRSEVVTQSMHYDADGSFSSDLTFSPFFGLHAHMGHNDEPSLPNAMLPVSIDFGNGHILDVGTCEFDPNSLDISSLLLNDDYPLLANSYPIPHPHPHYDMANFSVIDGQYQWDTYINPEQFA